MENSIEKLWLKSYPKDIKKEIDSSELVPIPKLVENTVKAYGPKIAFQNFGSTLTFKKMDELSHQFSSFLTHEAKLSKGDRIAIQLPNLLQYPIVMIGALKAGLIVVNTNPLYTEKEMLHQFKDARVKALVIFGPFAHKYNNIKDQLNIPTVITTYVGDLLGFPKSLIFNFVLNLKNKKEFKSQGKPVPNNHIPETKTFHECLKLGSQHEFKPTEVHIEDLAFLQYTGGTTGVAKGAELTHKNIVANMLQNIEWMKPKLTQGEEVILTPLPLYHIFSLTVNSFSFMYYGAKNVLITNPRDIPAFIKLMAKEKYTCISGVNTLFNALMNHPNFKNLNFENLKIAVAGGMALHNTVCTNWEKITGKPIIEGYGLTEASPVVCCNPINGTHKVDHIGLPLPSTECTILDDHEKPVPLGKRGELCVKGPQIMRGYWNNSEETKKVFTSKGGWLKTGDVAVMDNQGFFKIVDRKKDMILVSGFNVYPNEVEDALTSHPEILEVAAIGVKDFSSGEKVKVFIVKKDPKMTENEVQSFAKTCLTGYKIPSIVEFRDELPKTNVGKILRKQLRDEEFQKNRPH